MLAPRIENVLNPDQAQRGQAKASVGFPHRDPFRWLREQAERRLWDHGASTAGLHRYTSDDDEHCPSHRGSPSRAEGLQAALTFLGPAPRPADEVERRHTDQGDQYDGDPDVELTHLPTATSRAEEAVAPAASPECSQAVSVGSDVI